MKRLGMWAALGVLVLLGSVLPAMAQAPQTIAVTFSGEMRIHGFVFDNMADFTDTGTRATPVGLVSAPSVGGKPVAGGTVSKDSDSWFWQRWRLFTTVTSADKKAKAVWAVEVGDLVWGGINVAGQPQQGGASGAEFGGTGTRTRQNCCGGLGADAVAVETKLLYVQFDLPGIADSNILLGAHNIIFLSSPTGAFVDDDAYGIQLNFKWDPVDLQLWYAKADENRLENADDNQFWVARLGINITKDTRLTLEGMVVDAQCYARRATPVTLAEGTCVSASIGDTFWIGSTVGTKIGNVNLDGTVVYGQRRLFNARGDTTLAAPRGKEQIEERGFGFQLTARVPFGPVQTWFHGWYTTGDDNRPVGGGCGNQVGHPLCGGLANDAAGNGREFSTVSNTTRLTKDSDKLPIPIGGAAWLSAPFVAEWITGLRTLGAPAAVSTHYNDPTGTYGVGGSATYALTPALSIGGGVAFVGATEDTPGAYGKNAFEIDLGLLYTYNANLGFQAIFGYIFPDQGNDAYGLAFRTRFGF